MTEQPVPARRIAAAGLVLSLLAMFFGCGFLGGTTRNTVSDGLCHQNGRVTVPAGQEIDVYYPTPYAATPNLETDGKFGAPGMFDACVIEQKADHFRVKNNSPFPSKLKWAARGVPAAIVASQPPPVLQAEAVGAAATPGPAPGTK